MSKRDFYLALEAIVTDGLFTAPPNLMAESSPECFVYHWDYRSQFKNPWGGFAHHSLDYMCEFLCAQTRRRELIHGVRRAVWWPQRDPHGR